MKRFLIVEFDSEINCCFVWKHDGPSDCMVPITSREDVSTSIQTVPLDELLDAPYSDEELTAIILRQRKDNKESREACGTLGPVADSKSP